MKIVILISILIIVTTLITVMVKIKGRSKISFDKRLLTKIKD